MIQRLLTLNSLKKSENPKLAALKQIYLFEFQTSSQRTFSFDFQPSCSSDKQLLIKVVKQFHQPFLTLVKNYFRSKVSLPAFKKPTAKKYLQCFLKSSFYLHWCYVSCSYLLSLVNQQEQQSKAFVFIQCCRLLSDLHCYYDYCVILTNRYFVKARNPDGNFDFLTAVLQFCGQELFDLSFMIFTIQHSMVSSLFLNDC